MWQNIWVNKQILTSGTKAREKGGRDILNEMIQRAEGKITIVPEVQQKILMKFQKIVSSRYTALISVKYTKIF